MIISKWVAVTLAGMMLTITGIGTYVYRLGKEVEELKESHHRGSTERDDAQPKARTAVSASEKVKQVRIDSAFGKYFEQVKNDDRLTSAQKDAKCVGRTASVRGRVKDVSSQSRFTMDGNDGLEYNIGLKDGNTCGDLLTWGKEKEVAVTGTVTNVWFIINTVSMQSVDCD